MEVFNYLKTSPSYQKGLFIYIEEAHASDEWPIGSKIDIKQHQTNQARKDCLNLFIQKYPITKELFVCSFASVESKISERTNVWPFGIWIVRGGIVIDQILPKSDTTFDIQELLVRHY